MVAKRKQRAKEYKEKTEGDQLEFILTLDERMLPLDYTNGETEHYYALKKSKKEIGQHRLQPQPSNFPNNT